MATTDESRSASPIDAERHLVDAMALLGSLTGYISHELNNLLTPMRCYAELALQPGSDSKAAQRALELTKEGSDRASRLVQSLLDLARNVPEVSEPQGASLEASVEGALRFLPRNPADDGIVVSCSIPEGLHVCLPQDLLDHLLLNLILNARTAMLPKGGKLEILASVNCSTWNNQNVHLATIIIKDNGRGFTEELLRKETAEHSASGSDHRPQRTFGLDLCRRLVMHAAGTLTFESRVGLGTTCIIRLPAVAAKNTKQNTISASGL